MEENPSYGIVYCKAKFFGFKSREWKLPEYKFPEILLGNCIFVTSLFYKSDWEKVGGFDESFLDEWEDYDFWLKIISLGRKVYRIPKFYFYYRKGHDSRAKKNEYDQFVLYQKILKNHFELYSNNLEFILEKYLKIRIELNNSKSILNNPIKYIFFIFKRILKRYL
jgi:GT2 family glycosyltransferase